MIYFIETNGLVKIGHSNNPRRRLQMLSTGCPTNCTLIGVTEGGKEEEKAIHEKFSHLRQRGEWFRFSPEINQFISQNAVHLQPPSKITVKHPLTDFLRGAGETVSDFAKRINMSRMQLYRIMNGESTTTGRLRLISEATGGAVPMSAFLDEETAA